LGTATMPRIRSYALIKTVPFLVMAVIAAYQGMGLKTIVVALCCAGAVWAMTHWGVDRILKEARRQAAREQADESAPGNAPDQASPPDR
jgi:hypothetical protein